MPIRVNACCGSLVSFSPPLIVRLIERPRSHRQLIKSNCHTRRATTVCFHVVGISDDPLRVANDRVSSSVRLMPVSSHGHAWRWNGGGPAQILPVIAVMKYTAGELQPAERHANAIPTLDFRTSQFFFRWG